MIFLTFEEVLAFHESTVRAFGGALGILDRGKIESAIAQPMASYGGDYLYEFPWGMATTYLYGISKNHGFIDGNKRTATLAMVVFLAKNGWDVEVSDEDLIGAVLAITTNQMTREEFAEWLTTVGVRRSRKPRASRKSRKSRKSRRPKR